MELVILQNRSVLHVMAYIIGSQAKRFGCGLAEQLLYHACKQILESSHPLLSACKILYTGRID